MSDIDPSRDPGWPNLRDFGHRDVLLVLSGFGFRFVADRGGIAGMHGLRYLRVVFVCFVSWIFLIGAVLAFIVSGVEVTTASAVATAAVTLFGVWSMFGIRFFAKPLDCGTPEAVAARYRTRFFLEAAFAQSAALVGFVAVFIVGRAPWLYVIGAAWALVGFALLAPTTRHLAADQRRLDAMGCGQSLIAALAPLPDRA